MTNGKRPDKLEKEEHANQVEWDADISVPKLSFPVAASIVFALAVLCFVNSLDGDFVFDDSEAIIGNKDLLPETPISDLFSHDFWGRKLDSNTSHKSYRPLTVLTYRLNYLLAGNLNPFGFHWANIVLHGVVSVTFLAVFSVLLAGYRVERQSDKTVFGSPRSSFMCAVIFAIHPIHTESVAAVVGRADLLCALTFCLSFLFYAKSCYSPAYAQSYKPESFHVLPLSLSLLFCVVSIFCKEQGITVIGLCSIFDVVSVCRVDLAIFLGVRKQKIVEVNGYSSKINAKKSLSPWLRSLFYRQALLFLTGVTLLVIRWRVMGSSTPIFQVHDNPQSFVNGSMYRVLNYNYLYAINAWLLLNPFWLCFDWSMGCVPVITSFLDPRIIVVGVFWLMIGCLAVRSLSCRLSVDSRILQLSLALIIIPFLPASNLFFRVGFVVAERVLYLSTAGFCLLVVLGVRNISKTFQKSAAKKFVSLGFTYLTVIFILQSIQRSNDWRKELSLFTSGAHICPLNAKVHYNIGKLSTDNNNVEFAIEKYRLAIRLNPEYDQALNNLANILKESGQVLEAEQLLLKAVSIRTEFAAAWMNLGIVQADLKKNESSEASYLQALRHRRKYPDCYYNLGNLYLQMGRNSDAVKAWVNATNQKPTHINAWTNTLILLDNLGQLKEAVMIGKEALKFLKDDPQILFNLANIYGKMDKYQDSEKLFRRAIQVQHNNGKLYLNLGVLYHRWGKLEKAEEVYLTAQRLSPQDPSVRENLQMLHRKMGKLT